MKSSSNPIARASSPAALTSRDSAAIGTTRNIMLAAAKDAALAEVMPRPAAGEMTPGLQYVARKILEQRPMNLKDVQDAYRRLFPRGLENYEQKLVVSAVMSTLENRAADFRASIAPVAVATRDGRVA